MMATTKAPAGASGLTAPQLPGFEEYKPPGFDEMQLDDQLIALGVEFNYEEGENLYLMKQRMRITRNAKMLQIMGLTNTAENLCKDMLRKQPNLRRKPTGIPAPRKSHVPDPDFEPRRSKRTDSKKVNYHEAENLFQWVEKKKTKTRGTASRSRSSCNADPARVKVFAIQSDYAVGKAIEAAEAKAAEAGTDRGYAKKLEPSNCASGFWLQLPNALQAIWTFQQKTEWVELECDDMSRAGSARRDPWNPPIEGPWRNQNGEGNNRWRTVYLPKGDNLLPCGATSTSGLSGGWRGFAMDHELTPNDSVVWQVPADVPFGSLPAYFKTFIFRAEDYETEESSKYVVSYEEMKAKAEEELGALEARQAEAEAEDASVEDSAMEEPACEAGPSRAAGPMRAAKKAKTEPAAAEHKKGTRAADRASQAAQMAAGNKDASVAEVEPVLRKGKDEQAAVQEAEDEIFVVEVILAARGLSTADPLFKVRWVGYGEDEDTWEPLSMFDDDIFGYSWAEDAVKTKAQKYVHKWSK